MVSDYQKILEFCTCLEPERANVHFRNFRHYQLKRLNFVIRLHVETFFAESNN